jgi:hypothetical protein
VYNTTGEKLGSIDDLMIDKLSGQVCYAVLEFGGFLGVGNDQYSTDRRSYIVPLGKERLRTAPKYSETSVPVYDRDYGSRINSYYDSY